MRLKGLIENRNKLVAELNKLSETVNAPGREFSADDDTKYNKLVADVTATDAAIAREKQLATLAQNKHTSEEFDRHAPELFREAGVKPEDVITDADRSAALRGWLASGKGENVTDQQRRAMQKLGYRAEQKEIGLPLANMASVGELQDVWRNGSSAERAALLRGNTRIGAAGLLTSGSTAGLTLVPPGTIASQIEIGLLAFGGVRQNATVFRTADASPFKLPISNDTGNTGELLTEQATIGTTVDPTLGTKTLGGYKFSSKLQKFTAEMQRDSAFDLSAYIGRNLGERLGRVSNTYQTTGTGSSQPQGVVVGSAAGITAAGATAVTADELIDLVHSLDPAYWDGAKFMFHNSTAKILRKLKDGNGAYIWRDNYQNSTIANGFSPHLFGFETIINQDMPAMTTGLKPVLFGRFDKFVIRDVAEVRLKRFVELFGQTDEEAMIAFLTMDSILADPGTSPIKRITMS